MGNISLKKSGSSEQQKNQSKNQLLADNGQWESRFKIPSETSNRVYVIAQHKTKRHWGCSCPGWKRHRHCKHLKELGLPGDEKPFELPKK